MSSCRSVDIYQSHGAAASEYTHCISVGVVLRDASCRDGRRSNVPYWIENPSQLENTLCVIVLVSDNPAPVFPETLAPSTNTLSGSTITASVGGKTVTLGVKVGVWLRVSTRTNGLAGRISYFRNISARTDDSLASYGVTY